LCGPETRTRAARSVGIERGVIWFYFAAKAVPANACVLGPSTMRYGEPTPAHPFNHILVEAATNYVQMGALQVLFTEGRGAGQ